MIQVILGDKGSGKTKRLIDLANDALKQEHGNIIFVDDDKRYMYDLRHEIRFVDASEYPSVYKCDAHEFLGFLCGMLSADFDLSLIAVDAFKKLVKTDLSSCEWFFERLEELCQKHNVDFVLSVSEDPENLPEFMKGYLI